MSGKPRLVRAVGLSRRKNQNSNARLLSRPTVQTDVPSPADASVDLPAPEAGTQTPDPSAATWERVKLARHADRPKTLDYVKRLSFEFVEVHGDRRFGDDAAIVGGLAEFEGRTVMVIGHQKGKNTKENIARNFGMPSPEGYRKALRLMQQAEKFGFPLICFIDTPGAYPGLEGEERGVAQAIAENLMTLAQLRIPIISVVIGEGGSGGALAIGLADRVLMLENSIYSVASPEASASILWRDATKAPVAAATMKITAQDLLSLGVVDEVLPEPEGGAHSEPGIMTDTVKEALLRHLSELEVKLAEGGPDAMQYLLDERYAKFRKMGAFEEPA